MYATLPSQAVWVFDFVWSVIVPCLADPWVLVRNEQITTDGDNKIYTHLLPSSPMPTQEMSTDFVHITLLPKLGHRMASQHCISKVKLTKELQFWMWSSSGLWHGLQM
jgi:hypothetical protein